MTTTTAPDETIADALNATFRDLAPALAVKFGLNFSDLMVVVARACMANAAAAVVAGYGLRGNDGTELVAEIQSTVVKWLERQETPHDGNGN